MHDKEFAGRKVLVTGAGKGIGRAIVTMLCARGADVTALTRTGADRGALLRLTGVYHNLLRRWAES